MKKIRNAGKNSNIKNKSQYRKTKIVLNEKNMYKAYLKISLPLVAANLMRAIHDITDSFFLGRIGEDSSVQAAVSMAFPFYDLLSAVGIGLAVAGVALISRAVGKENDEEAAAYSRQLFLLALVSGIVVNAIAFLTAGKVLGMMGAEEEVLGLATEYIRIRSFEFTAGFIFIAYQAVRQARGDTVSTLAVSGVNIAANIIFSAVFIYVFHMGVAGVALAAVFAAVVIMPVAVKEYYNQQTVSKAVIKNTSLIKKAKTGIKAKNKSENELIERTGRQMSASGIKENPAILKLTDIFDKEYSIRIIRLASWPVFSQLLSCLGFFILQGIILTYGNEASAAFGIGNRISNVLLAFASAVGVVSSTFVGQNLGAGQADRVRESCKTAVKLSIYVTLGEIMILFFLRNTVADLFSKDGETIQAVKEYLVWIMVSQVFLSLYQVMLGILNGLADTRSAFWLGISRIWFTRLVLVIGFKQFCGMGRQEIWWAVTISSIAVAVFGFWLVKKSLAKHFSSRAI